MEPAELIRAAMRRPLVHEDGDPLHIELLAPLTDDEISEFAEELPCPLPGDIRALLAFCRGFEGSAADIVDFTGKACMFEYEEIFPHGLPVAGDGFGNFWVVDLLPTSRHWGPVYFACHDAPVVLYQSESLTDFLDELFRLNEAPFTSLVDDVHEDRLFDVWRRNPGVQSHDDCLASEDATLRDFAARLDASFQIVDMRKAPVGFGFSWGRYGPRTVVCRHGTLPIFAYQKPEGLLKRLLGRRPTTG